MLSLEWKVLLTCDIRMRSRLLKIMKEEDSHFNAPASTVNGIDFYLSRTEVGSFLRHTHWYVWMNFITYFTKRTVQYWMWFGQLPGAKSTVEYWMWFDQLPGAKSTAQYWMWFDQLPGAKSTARYWMWFDQLPGATCSLVQDWGVSCRFIIDNRNFQDLNFWSRFHRKVRNVTSTPSMWQDGGNEKMLWKKFIMTAIVTLIFDDDSFDIRTATSLRGKMVNRLSVGALT